MSVMHANSFSLQLILFKYKTIGRIFGTAFTYLATYRIRTYPECE